MRRLLQILGLTLMAISIARNACAEIDERPLNVKIVPAFPDLQWPDSLTGADSGVAKPLLPLALCGAGDGSDRVFITTQYGRVFSFENSSTATRLTKFLDISDRVRFDPNENEEGLLGLAFHPKFKDNGKFFIYYTPRWMMGVRGGRSFRVFDFPMRTRARVMQKARRL